MRRVRSLLAAGLNTAIIATILPCLRDEGERLVPTCSDVVADLTKGRERITKAITDLQTSRAALDKVIAAAPADVQARRVSASFADLVVVEAALAFGGSEAFLDRPPRAGDGHVYESGRDVIEDRQRGPGEAYSGSEPAPLPWPPNTLRP
ncbi:MULTISPECIES: hypothetical protein [Nocardia]|uniref:hypothetical protein n=1 Tax=Nocardia TaxID=1817 RepID=UPI0002E339D9|nr:hypothetical protein [Nocardia araoensis]